MAPALASELAPTPAELIVGAAEVASAPVEPTPGYQPPPEPEAPEPSTSESQKLAPQTSELQTSELQTSEPQAQTPKPQTPKPQTPKPQTPETQTQTQTADAETPEADLTARESDRIEPWAKLIADPGHAPELLALAAVQSIGPQAREWLERTKRDYPTADEAALARLATNQFTRAGGLGSIFGAVAGSYAPVALLGTAAFAHAELILHVAAAYGLDPLAPERAVDLLILTRVHPDRAGAEAALAAARRPPYDGDGGLSAAVWRLSRMITTRIGGWGLVRVINRYLPGVSLLTAFLTSRASAESVAARANAHYRQEKAR